MLALHLVTMDRQSQILSHLTVVDSLDTDLLESLREVGKVGVVIELSAVSETLGPSKDGSNWIGRGFLTLLVLAVVTSDGTVGSLTLDGLTIWSDLNKENK